MKAIRISLCLVAVFALMIIACGGSDDSGINTSATASDFVGTWVGDVTIKDSNTGIGYTVDATIVFTESGGQVTGTIVGDTDFELRTLTGTVTDGKLNFDLPVAPGDAEIPDCVDWDMPTSCTLNKSLTTLEFSASGTVCGTTGTIKGSFTKQ